MAVLAPKCDFKLGGIEGLFLELMKLKDYLVKIYVHNIIYH